MSRLSRFLPWLPFVGACLFVWMFGRPTPLTDEWNLLRGALRLSQAHTLGETIDALVWFSYTHCVIVPFLFFYVPIEFLTGFDSRALMILTLLCHASILVTLARRLAPPPWVLLLVGLVLFSPARYVEILWGFEFTIALSIAFPVWALYVLDGTAAADDARTFTRQVGTATLLLVLGVLSSAGAFLGFGAAIVVVAVKSLTLRRRALAAGSILAMGTLLYLLMAHRVEATGQVATSPFLGLLTCAGGTLVSGPVAFEQFSWNTTTWLGLGVIVAAVLLVVRAARLGFLHEVALPVGLIAFGLLASTAIAVNRAYIANWHLEHMLPTIGGTLVLAWVSWQRSGRRIDQALCAGVSCAMLSCIVGWSYGFRTGGPEFNEYARSIEHYIATYERDPGQAMPFPPMGPWSIDYPMIAFLREFDHPVLRSP